MSHVKMVTLRGVLEALYDVSVCVWLLSWMDPLESLQDVFVFVLVFFLSVLALLQVDPKAWDDLYLKFGHLEFLFIFFDF